MASPEPALGIDIGGTQIKWVLVEPDGTLICSQQVPTVDDAEALISTIAEIIAESPRPFSTLGISAPGIAATDNRSIAWMRGRLQAVEGLRWHVELDREVWVLNDAHAAALAESWIGAAQGRRQVVLLTLGTGVGGGVIVDGKLLQGATGRAGHLGHITLNRNGSPDIVGMPGSLEDAIGNHSVSARSGFQFSSTFELLEAVAAGDDQAIRCWRESVDGLAVGIASIINCFDPEVVVLGGGISECGGILFDTLKQAMVNHEWRPLGTGVPIIPAELGAQAGAIGAARYAFSKSEEQI
jgi:glucokinase